MSCCNHDHHEHPHEDDEVAEMHHFREIVDSMKNYRIDCDISSLDKKTKTAVEINARFLDSIVADSGALFGDSADSVTEPSQPTASHNVSKVRSTLKQFVREWSKEGAEEREKCFTPLLEGLTKYLPINGKSSPAPFVLCPGSGLGRLPYEIASLGYDCQGNEFSYHMLLGSHFILNSPKISASESALIFPYALSYTNVRSGESDRLRPIRIPDILPGRTKGQMSMCAGEFVEVYERQGYGIADGIVTCFFIDTAKNILLYIRTIANAIKKGGVWINMGPLLYHYAEHHDAISVEFSWEEVREFISDFFNIEEEKTGIECVYSSNARAMNKTVYKCFYFAARRNGKLVDGYSNPVF
jgi:carnosine N-methyltransferase